jgi:2-polyprenyl-3-methyl-5-hydroxy-6-metoxy-1,4-benzoquinol methylase
VRIIKSAFARLWRCFVYKQYDSSAYWKSRAADPGQAAVLWRNQEYNELYRQIQREILADALGNSPEGGKILDIGCGVGVVAIMMSELRKDVMIDAVDFSEMISVARKNNFQPSVQYIESSAEEYDAGPDQYDVIVSSGCYSAIRNIPTLEKALALGARMLKPGGLMIMIDPFHRWNYLARAKYATRDVAKFLMSKGLILESKSGVLFWPFRDFLASSNVTGKRLAKFFFLGEGLMHALGSHLWADYKVLRFRKR